MTAVLYQSWIIFNTQQHHKSCFILQISSSPSNDIPSSYIAENGKLETLWSRRTFIIYLDILTVCSLTAIHQNCSQDIFINLCAGPNLYMNIIEIVSNSSCKHFHVSFLYVFSSHCWFTSCLILRSPWWTAGWRCLQWQWWAAAEAQRPGHVQDAEVESQTASCSSPWNGIGTRGASSAPAAMLSSASTAAPATAKEAWSSARTTT